MADLFLPDGASIDPALLDQIPAMQAPPGLTSNFNNPPSLSYVVIITVGVTLPLMVVFLVMRVYTRIKIARDFTPDDYLCVAGAVCSILYTSLIFAMLDIPGGGPAGRHVWDVPISHISRDYLKESISVSALFAVGAVLVKTTLLAFYLRLFRPILRARILIWAGIVVVTLFYGSFIISYLVLCVPGLSTSPQCTNFTTKISLAHGLFSAVTDFYILCIPLQMISTLQLSRRRKLSVSTVFATGLLACAASIAGVVFRFQMSRSPDFTWISVPVYATVIAEYNIGIICSCMPVVFALFKDFSKSIGTKWTSLIRSQRTNSQGTNLKSEELESLPNTLGENGSFPVIPYAELAGVKTFVHKVQYTSPHGKMIPFKSTDPYSEIGSEDYDSDRIHMENLRPYEVDITASSDRNHDWRSSVRGLTPGY